MRNTIRLNAKGKFGIKIRIEECTGNIFVKYVRKIM